MNYTCSRCQHVITDRHLVNCDSRFWHEGCLRCQLCDRRAADGLQSFFAFGDQHVLLCRQDYERLRRTCVVCALVLTDRDLVVRVQSHRVVHVSCLVCSVCSLSLSAGDRFSLTASNQVVCANHHMTQASVSSSTSGAQNDVLSTAAAQAMPSTATTSTRGKRGRKRLV